MKTKLNNFNQRNLENIDKLINEESPKRFGMFVNESGKGEVKISKESRKKCAKSLLR